MNNITFQSCTVKTMPINPYVNMTDQRMWYQIKSLQKSHSMKTMNNKWGLAREYLPSQSQLFWRPTLHPNELTIFAQSIQTSPGGSFQINIHRYPICWANTTPYITWVCSTLWDHYWLECPGMHPQCTATTQKPQKLSTPSVTYSNDNLSYVWLTQEKNCHMCGHYLIRIPNRYCCVCYMQQHTEHSNFLSLACFLW